MDRNLFWTRSLRAAIRGEDVVQILAAAINAVDPIKAVHLHLRRSGDKLIISGINSQEHLINLADFNCIYLVAVGKASVPMAGALVNVLEDKLTRGIVLAKDGHILNTVDYPANVKVYTAAHPIPDERAVLATQQITSLLEQAGNDDLVFLLVSGGGSALLTAPAEGIKLHDIQQLTDVLLDSGATINELNTLRKHIDRAKGGGLARVAYPARLISLILSDVVGDPIDVIASGPATPDPTTFFQCRQIIDKYGIATRIPKRIINLLSAGLAGKIIETPKQGDPIFQRVNNFIIGNNLLAAEAACTWAQQAGFNSLLLTTHLQGEARQAGQFISAISKQIAVQNQPIKRPACIVIGGETTVTINGDGLGGRNQELALGAVRPCAGLKDIAIIALASDGEDGPTDAAGAVVTGSSFAEATELGLAPTDYLQRNDAYHFFKALGDLIITGPTNTNVNDLTFIFAF